MRKITKEAVEAFETATKYKNNNTAIVVLENVTIMYLHGNAIAYLYNDPRRTLTISNCGWFSNTTKERLNGIKGVSIQQKKGVWYLNGEEWNGKPKDVKK